jgi:hypothetical protein
MYSRAILKSLSRRSRVSAWRANSKQYRAYSSNLLSILDDIGSTNVLIAGIQRDALTKVPSTSPLAKLVQDGEPGQLQMRLSTQQGPVNRRG